MAFPPWRVWWIGALLAATAAAAPPWRVLLLTGANNHDWRATTPVLQALLEEDGRFTVDVRTNVADVAGGDFARCDVVLSNFNTFGAKDPGPVWTPGVRAQFEDWLRGGGGLVIVHAGSSVFYDWPAFQQAAGAAWGPGTHHGAVHSNVVSLVGAHPITAGLAPLPACDEFWESPALATGATVLAEVTPQPAHRGSGKPEPSALVTSFGQGRGFTLLLGHDARTMGSPAFRTLLRRGTEWAACGAVAPATAAHETKHGGSE